MKINIILKWFVVGLLMLYIWYAIYEAKHLPGGGHCTGEESMCGSCAACSATSAGSVTSVTGDKLLPVMDPCFNMREVCKQSILLEDHLNSQGKDCNDCIRKHFLNIEALCEEAVALDTTHKYPDIRELPSKIRSIIKDFLKTKDKFKTSQKVRQIRKQYMNKYFDAF